MVKLVVLEDPQIKLMYDLVMCDLPETSDMLQLMIIHMIIAAKSYKFKRNFFLSSMYQVGELYQEIM